MKSSNPNINRRRMLKFAALTPLATLFTPDAIVANHRTLPVPKGTTILFQGDSITDAGRDRAQYYPNNRGGMGGGYVYQIVADLLAQNPADDIKCYNRGISGNKVYQLAERWQDDCLNLNPQILSILIGVNDYWHTLRSDYEGTPEVFDRDLRALLNTTREALPGIKFMLGEPFAVKGGTAITAEWQEGFPPYQQSVKEIAGDFNASFIPYQSVFDEALEKAPVEHWCPDGVHPSMAGANLMKDAWLQEFNKIV